MEVRKNISVTDLLSYYSEKFNTDFWSLYKAVERLLSRDEFKMINKKMLETYKVNYKELEDFNITEEQVKAMQQDILEEWASSNEEHRQRGVAIHGKLEQSYLGSNKQVDLGQFGLSESFSCFEKGNYDLENHDKCVCPEFEIHCNVDGLQINGRIDLLVKDGEDLYLFDYKVTKSISNKAGFDTRVKRSKTFKYPISNMDDCDLNKYTLQLSFYAHMLELAYPSLKVKRLVIVHIDDKERQTNIDINYKKREVEAIIRHELKKLKQEEQRERRAPIIY